MDTLQNNEMDSEKNNPQSGNDMDLRDSEKDEKAMEEDEVLLDLPDVADIPGQENIIPPKMGMFADTTISSDGEEGTEVFDEDDEEEL